MDDHPYHFIPDKSGHQPFDFIGRGDLLISACGSGPMVFTDLLRSEYEYHYSNLSAANTLAITTNDRADMTYLISADGSQSLSAQHATLTGSWYGGAIPSAQSIFLVSSDDLRITAQAQGITNATLMTDDELVFLGQYFGVIPISNDSDVHSRLSHSQSPCFRPTDVLIANVFSGNLTYLQAEEYWKAWRAHDRGWVHGGHRGFRDCWRRSDVKNISIHFRMFA